MAARPQTRVRPLLPGSLPDEHPTRSARLHHRRPPQLRDPQRGAKPTLVSPSAPPSYVPTVRAATWMSASEGERTALRQAVRPNGIRLSSAVTLAVTGRWDGIVGEPAVVCATAPGRSRPCVSFGCLRRIQLLS